jgi:putative restriction endonuclease
MSIDYLNKLTRLRTDKNRHRWTEATAFRAPHKPLLILLVLNLGSIWEIRNNYLILLF